MDWFGAAGLGAGLLGSLFGGNDSEATPERQYTGYYALPPEARSAYDKYFAKLNSLGNNPYDTARLNRVVKPSSPFDSQELYRLQQATPDRGVEQVGVLEPFHEYEKNALTQAGNPDYSYGALSKYFDPYHQIVTQSALNQANRTADLNRNFINTYSQQFGGRVGGENSALHTQLNENERNRAEVLADVAGRYGSQGFNNAVELRDKSLAGMFEAGGAIRGQNQAKLDAASGRGLSQNNPAYGQLQALMQLLQGIPGASESTGAQAAVPSAISKLGNVLLAGFGNQGGGGGQKGGQSGGGNNGWFGYGR